MYKKYSKLFMLIIAAGIVLRIWGIGFGLPYQFHQDEPMVVNHAMAFGSGDLNPHYFVIPPLTSYFLFFIYAVYFIIGKMSGIFANTEVFALSFFKDPTAFYLLGRFFAGVIPGVLSIILIRRLYKTIFPSGRGSIFSAAVVSFSFLNVMNSHYIYADTLMSMFVILSMISIFKMRDTPNWTNYLSSGLAIGFAVATKYNAALLVIPFSIAHITVCKGRIINMRVILAVGLILVTFFILNPFALIDYKFFIGSVLRQSHAESFTGWFHHIKHSLHESLGIGLLTLGVLGLIVMVVKDRVSGLILASFPAVFYLHLVFFSQNFSRYVISLIPFLAVGAGYIIFECILPKLKQLTARILLIIACSVIFVPLIVKSAKADLLLSSKDTRIEAAEWCGKNIDNHSRIAFDHTFFRPIVLQDKEQLIEKYNSKNNPMFFKELKSKKAEFLIKAQADKKSYHIYFLNQLLESGDPYVTSMPNLPFDLELLKNKGVEYVVVNYSDRQKNVEKFYEKLKSEAVLAASFSPYEDKAIRMSYDIVETTCQPVMSKEIYSRIRSGPALEIYRLKR